MHAEPRLWGSQWWTEPRTRHRSSPQAKPRTVSGLVWGRHRTASLSPQPPAEPSEKRQGLDGWTPCRCLLNPGLGPSEEVRNLGNSGSAPWQKFPQKPCSQGGPFEAETKSSFQLPSVFSITDQSSNADFNRICSCNKNIHRI